MSIRLYTEVCVVDSARWCFISPTRHSNSSVTLQKAGVQYRDDDVHNISLRLLSLWDRGCQKRLGRLYLRKPSLLRWRYPCDTLAASLLEHASFCEVHTAMRKRV